jgi:hypothetical protein
LKTRDTVATETPHRRASSRIVVIKLQVSKSFSEQDTTILRRVKSG